MAFGRQAYSKRSTPSTRRRAHSQKNNIQTNTNKPRFSKSEEPNDPHSIIKIFCYLREPVGSPLHPAAPVAGAGPPYGPFSEAVRFNMPDETGNSIRKIRLCGAAPRGGPDQKGHDHHPRRQYSAYRRRRRGPDRVRNPQPAKQRLDLGPVAHGRRDRPAAG